METYRFEWDERKNQANIRKHGFDFHDAFLLFEGPMLVGPDESEAHGEERWLGFGFARDVLVAIAFTTRGSQTIRVISMRKATKYEEEEFNQAVRN